MANTLEILIQAKDNASPAMKNVAASASAMGKEVDAAANKMQAAGTKAAKFEQVAQKIDSAGRNARIGLSSMGQAAQLLGANLTGVTGVAAGAADAIGDIVGFGGALGPVGVALAAITAAIGLYMAKMQELRTAMTASIATNNDYLRNLYSLAKAYPEIAAKAKEYAAALADVQIAQMQAQAAANQNIIVQQIFAQRLTDAKAAADGIKASLDAMVWGAQSGYDSIENLRGSMAGLITTTDAAATSAANHAMQLDYEAAAARRAAAAMGDTRGEAIKDFREGAKSVSEMNTKAWLATHEFQAGAGWVEKIGANAAKASSSISQMASKLKSLVEGALNPTTVADRMGMAGDAWDEFRLRLEAVATGTNPAQYGEQFVKMFNDLGMSAEQAARAFKDFSLFADPKNIQLVNMQPIIDSVKNSLDQMIGKANLTSAAMKQVWANLSPQQKAALAEQGIDNASEAITALIDPTSQAKTQVQKLGAAMNAIPNSITTTFNVVKDAAEQAIKDFQQVLDDFIAKYSSVTISINAETNATAPTSGAAPPPTVEETNGNRFARGTDFIVPAGFPNDSYSFRGNLTSGERVTITPRGNQGGGHSFVFNVSVNSEAMLNALMRKVRALAMLNAV